MWRAIRNGGVLQSTVDCYKIYDFQYQMRPAAAINIARDTTSLISGITRTQDPVLQDSYATPAVKLMQAIQEETKGSFDPNLAGHHYKTIWVSVSENRPQNEVVKDLATAITEYWTTIYKLNPAQAKKAAEMRANALAGAFATPPDQVNWGKVSADLKASWTELRKVVPQPPKPEKKP